MQHFSILFHLVHASTALAGLQARSSDFLVILDTGIGHRSTPIPRWPTSLRRLDADGTNATILSQFGVPLNSTKDEPIGANALAYSSSTSTLFSVTKRGVTRTNLDGSNEELIVQNAESGQIVSITVAEKLQRLYYGVSYDGLMYSANYDGTDVTLFRNVSQGIQFSSPTYTPANSHPGGIIVDEERGWLYWSSVKGEKDGSIRRVPLNGGGEEQILATGIDKPGQLRIAGASLFWTERGSWSNSPTAIKYLDRLIDQLPASPYSPNLAVPTGALIQSSQSPLFTEADYTGEKQILGIETFVVYRNNVEQIVYFGANSAGRTTFGKVVEVRWRGSGGSRGPVFTVLSADTEEVGVPVGLEYVL